MQHSRLIAGLSNLFRPPFTHAAWLVVGYVLLSVIYNTGSNFHHGTFPDTDDYVRWLQVFNWLDGQSWHDLTLKRLYPAHPVEMHWARLPDLALSVFVRLFDSLDLPRQTSAMLTGMIMPLVLLFFMARVLRAQARPLLSRHYTAGAAFLILFTPQLIFQFLPLRVDHHAYILLFAGVMFYALQNIALHLHVTRLSLLAAFSAALALWNGAEILPVLAFTCLFLAGLTLSDPKTAKAGPLFGISLFASSLFLLPIARAPGQLLDVAYDSFSIFYVVMAAFIASYFVLLFMLGRLVRSFAIRLGAAVLLTLLGLLLFLQAFPAFIFGPYTAANPLLDIYFFPNIREAVPLPQAWHDAQGSFGHAPHEMAAAMLYFFVSRLFVPVVGLIACFFALRQGGSRRYYRLWLLWVLFVAGFLLLAFFWQVRVMSYAQLFAIPPFCWLLLQIMKSLKHRYQGRRLFLLQGLAALSFTVLPVVVVPGILMQSRVMPDMLFYLGGGVEPTCGPRTHVIATLNQLQKEARTPLTIMAPLDYTPELLFHTAARYIAAPYHRNDRGIIDMVTLFRSSAPDAPARAIATKLDLDYVLVCKPAYYGVTLDGGVDVQRYFDNQMKPVADAATFNKAPLGVRLAADHPPAWLKTVFIPFEGDFALYAVDRKQLAKP